MLGLSFAGAKLGDPTTYEFHGKQKQARSMSLALRDLIPEVKTIKVFVTPSARETWAKQLPIEFFEMVDIPDGSTEKQLWTIFDTIIDAVPEPAPPVVFDVTHSFRSIPVISLLAIAYLRAVRDVRVEKLLYGAFDASKPNAHGINITPVFDLTPMTLLLDWLEAANAFRTSLDGSLLSRMLKEIQNNAYRDNRPNAPKNLVKVGTQIDALTRALRLARVREVINVAPHTRDKLNTDTLVKEADTWAKPFNVIRPKLMETIENIGTSGDEKNLETHLNLAKLYSKRKLYMESLSVLREWIVSHGCVLANKSNDVFKKKVREEVEDALNSANPWRKSKDEQTVPKWTQTSNGKELVKLFSKVGQVRNDVDHIGMRQDPDRAEKIEKKVNKYICKALDLNKMLKTDC